MQRFACALLILASCHENTLITPPALGGAQSGLVVIATDTIDTVLAFDGEPDYPLVAYQHEATIYVVSYNCPLASMGLLEGHQDLAPPGESTGAPSPYAIHKTELPKGAWVQLEEPDDFLAPVLDRVRLDRESLCEGLQPKYETYPMKLQHEGVPIVTFGTMINSNRVLIGTTDHSYDFEEGNFFLLSPSLGVSEIESMRGASYRAGFTTDDGVTWLMDVHGNLYRGTVDDGFAFVSRSPAVSSSTVGVTTMDIDGARGGAPFELFVATSSRSFERFDGTNWETISLSPPNWHPYWRAQVVWVGPGEAIALEQSEAQQAMVRYRNGEELLEPLPFEYEATGIGFHPELGAIAASEQGYIARYVNQAWSPFKTDLGPYRMRFIEPVGPGFFAAGRYSFTVSTFDGVFFHPEIGFCKAPTFTKRQVFRTVQRPDGLIVLIEYESEANFVPLMALRPIRSALLCGGVNE